MIALTPPSRATRAGLVFGTAVVGACALLACAAGPALAADAAFSDREAGESRFETLPRLPGEVLQPRRAVVPQAKPVTAAVPAPWMGVGALAGGAMAGLGLGTLASIPGPTAALLGGSVGVGVFAAWAAVDALRKPAPHAGVMPEILTISGRPSL